MKEAMKLALEAMKTVYWHGGGSCWIIDAEKLEDAEKALEEALAKQEQGSTTCDKPVACCVLRTLVAIDKNGIETWRDEPLYDVPRKPLTDEMIVAGGKALAKLHADTCGLDFDDVWKYYAEDHKADAKAAIEAAHGIAPQGSNK